MPNIFPPLQTANDAVTAAQQKLQTDTPQKYDYSAHGILGNVGHVLGRVGNIAADILDPRVTPMIPGTDQYKQARVAEDQGELDKASQRQEIAQSESDRVANEQANREAEAPGREAATNQKNAETDKLGKPSYQVITSDQGMFAHNPQTNELIPLTQDGKPLTKASSAKAVSPEQQYLTEYQQQHQGSTVAEAERHYKLDTTVQNPPQALIFTPGENGGYTAQAARPGSTIAPGAMTAAGVNSSNTPTSMQRNAAGRADLVLQSIPDVMKDLETNGNELGPGMGRFNDIYQGKVGAPNPQFAGLMSDLHLLGTAVALAHAQGRMSNELLNEFNHMIASPNQSPENIKAVLGKVQNFMTKASKQGQAKGAAAAAAQPAADYKLVNGKLVKQ